MVPCPTSKTRSRDNALQVGTVSSSLLTAGALDVLVEALDVCEATKAADRMTQPRQTNEGCHAK